MNSKHLTAGSEFPPLQEGKLRIYSMRFCPFAHKVLLVAAAKKIPADIINLNLKSKPEWFIERNPSGKVPTIETSHGALYESVIVAEYLDDAFPNQKLIPSDPYQKALDKIWIENSAKIGNIIMKVSGYPWDKGLRQTLNDEETKELLEVFKPFEVELKRRGTLFFGGSQPAFIDYMFWPWFERFPIFELMFPGHHVHETIKVQNPKLESWRRAMTQDPAVNSISLSPENHLAYMTSYTTGTVRPNYELLHQNTANSK